MKRILLILTVLLSGLGLRGQDARFEAARELFLEGKTLAAARAFHALAASAEDENLRLRSLLAEGECYYALHLASDLASVRQAVDDALWERGDLFHYRNDLDSASLVLREAFLKLSGSSCILSRDYEAAESYFDRAEGDLQRLREISLFDSVEAERTLQRERVSLCYLMKDYGRAARYSQASLDRLLDSGFGPDGEPTDDFAEAVSAHALVLCRLGRFEQAAAVLDYIPDWNRFPHYQRRIGQMALMRHDADPEQSLGARDAYRRYRDFMLADIEQRLTEMTEAQREQYWLSLQPFLLDAYRLGAADPELLYDLALLSKGYLITYGRDRTRTDWRQVQRALQEGECAVEFVEYAGRGDARRMGALVLRKDAAAPVFVDVLDVGDFLGRKLFDITVEEAIAQEDPWGKNMLYGSPSLARAVWPAKLVGAIGDARTVYFAPDGFLHALAIEYMLPDALGGVRVSRLSSTRVLARQDRAVRRHGKALFVGGVDYASEIRSHHPGNDRLAYEEYVRSTDYPNEINALPYTLTEVETLMDIRGNRKDKILKADQATDEALCSLLPSGWDMVHIATHGYCLGNWFSSDLDPVEADPGMSRSGIMLAGLETSSNDQSFDYDYYDGCLSAREMARQDFSRVGLVVLSACQTGLGLAYPEGVFGLQRGLKMAGAGGLVLSLWCVSDAGTCELMSRFYRGMKEGDSVRDAFEKARNDLQEEGYSPFVFDAFILIDCI